MDIDDFLVRKRGTVHGLMPYVLRVQRLWIDGRDRWVSLSRWAAEQELQERFGDSHAALALLEPQLGCAGRAEHRLAPCGRPEPAQRERMSRGIRWRMVTHRS